jgi:hypothetical protein
MHIKHELPVRIKRPLVTLDTKLRDFPPQFIRDVAPNIAFFGFEPCWIWTGSVDKKGYPRRQWRDMDGRPQSVYIRPYVAKMFWDYPYEGSVKLACPNLNCVNPAHMVIYRNKRKKR